MRRACVCVRCMAMHECTPVKPRCCFKNAKRSALFASKSSLSLWLSDMPCMCIKMQARCTGAEWRVSEFWSGWHEIAPFCLSPCKFIPERHASAHHTTEARCAAQRTQPCALSFGHTLICQGLSTFTHATHIRHTHLPLHAHAHAHACIPLPSPHSRSSLSLSGLEGSQ